MELNKRNKLIFWGIFGIVFLIILAFGIYGLCTVDLY